MAGRPKLHIAVWHAYLAPYRARPKVQKVLRWIEHGVHIDWETPHAAVQQRHPRYQSKLAQVQELLQQHGQSEENIAWRLQQAKPPPFCFQNRVST